MPAACLPDDTSVAELERALACEGMCAVRVLGTSMRPTLLGGDVVLLEPVAAEKLRFGDLVAVRTEGGGGARMILHRFVRGARAGAGTLLWLKGDGVGRLDCFGEGPGDRLLGRVRAAWRGQVPLRHVQGFAAIACGCASLLALPWQRLRGHG